MDRDRDRRRVFFLSLREVAIALFALALGVLLAVAGPLRTIARRSKRAPSHARRRVVGGSGGGGGLDGLELSYQSLTSHARHPVLCPTNTTAPGHSSL